jgi:hypothetical protein
MNSQPLEDEVTSMMKLTPRKFLLVGVALFAATVAAHSAGLWPGFPTPGNSLLTNPPTGNETIPADTNLPQGENPATEVIPLGLLANLGGVGMKNLVIGGDFNQNTMLPAAVSAATPSTAINGATHWWVYSSTNTVTATRQTGAADTIPAAGLLASYRVSRPSTTTVTAICIGQTMDAAQFAPALGHTVVLSFWALQGSTFAASANSQMTAAIRYYTAADSATPFTNSATYALGTTTNLTNVAPTTATVISSTWTRYSVSGVVPTATAAGTAVTGGGVDFCYTPLAATTGASTEWFELAGVQLEVMQGTNIVPSQFEHRPITVEQALQQRYMQSGGLGTEIAAAFYQAGGCQASGNANFYIPMAAPLRVAPTAATSTLTAGGYSIKTAAAVTAIGTITFPAANIYGVTLNSNAACTSTLPYQIVGSNTTGLILFSAEP